MRFYMKLICLLLFTGCSVFKNTTKQTDEQHLSVTQKSAINSKEQKDWSAKSTSLLFYKDSAQRDYMVQLWPKGMFSFSAEKGFYGEADSMLIHGSSGELRAGAKVENKAETDKGSEILEARTEDQLVSAQDHRITKQNLSWKVIIASVMIIGLIIWFIVKK